MSLPSNLYKYERVSLQSLVNLLARVVYFGSPKNFNDPYDCAISAIVQELSEAGVSRLLAEANAVHLKAIEPNMRSMFTDSAKATLDEITEHFKQNSGVSCFTETNDNLLMWSHYADRGTGMCLEFSTSDELFRKAKPVVYSDSIPAISADELLIDKNYSKATELYCTKSKDWSYEREWRAFHKTAGTKFGYAASSLTAVFLGPRITNEMANLVATMLKDYESPVPLYTSQPSTTQFKMEFTLVKRGS